MGAGFKLVDIDSNVAVIENKYVKLKSAAGVGAGFGVITGAGSSGDPWILTLGFTNTT